MRVVLEGRIRKGVLRQRLVCNASDFASCIRRCKVKVLRVKKVIREGRKRRIEVGVYRVTAFDKAGNKNTRRETYRRVKFHRLR